MAINKTELVNAVAEKTGFTKKNSAAAYDALFAAIEEFLANGEKVQVVGFGSFDVRDRAERKGRDFQTGKEIVIPATKVPGFKAGSKLKEAVK